MVGNDYTQYELSILKYTAFILCYTQRECGYFANTTDHNYFRSHLHEEFDLRALSHLCFSFSALQCPPVSTGSTKWFESVAVSAKTSQRFSESL